jgi:uncharacterized membrane-anchored protein YhcB (DUF1043 family)
MKYALFGIVLLLYLLPLTCFSQESTESSVSGKVINFPSKLFSRIQGKTADLGKQLTSQTDKYLAKMAKREERLRKKLYKVDSSAAKDLFSHSAQQYAALSQKLKTDTGSRSQSMSGEYQPYTDSLKVTLSFLQQNPSASSLSPKMQAELQSSVSQLQALQAKMQDADQIKAYIQQRKQQIGDYITRHASLAGTLGKQYQGMSQDLFYYSQTIRQYKELLNNPDALEQKALTLLNQLLDFQSFMKQNSQLANLFNLPANYGTPQGLLGLQTRDQVGSLIQGQVASGGTGGAAALQSNLQSAESQLDGYKDKLSQLGNGSGDIEMPNFKPNDQKTKTFWKRLEYGTNFQTTRNNYYFPTVTDLGLSVGYKLGNVSTIGIGISYKLGWGNGIQHVALSSNGLGLRSFIDIKIKGSFYFSGGIEYNYTTPFSSAQQLRHWDDWSKSGLIGISKTISVKSRVFKKTRLQLLWDFLSYSQIPKTQAIIFRVGYGF